MFIFTVKVSVPSLVLKPLYTDRLFHCYMLGESICHFRGVGSILSLLFYFDGTILLAKNKDPDQMPYQVVSGLDLHYLPLMGFQVRIG